MKNLIPSTQATGLIQIGFQLLDHTYKMDQIEKSYKIAKRNMKQEHRLQMKKLSNDMASFIEMAKLQAQQSQQSHLERMALTSVLHNLSLGYTQVTNPQSHQVLQEMMTLIINELRDSTQTHINFLEYAQITPMIGGK